MTELAESVQLSRELYDIGRLQIQIHPDKPGASELIKRGNIVVINNDPHKSAIIRDFELDESRTACCYMVYGETGAGLLSQRVSVPPTNAQSPGAAGYDRISGPVETVLKHFVDKHIVNPYDQSRKIPGVTVMADKGRGPVTSAQLRYTYLSDDLPKIAAQSEMGFEIYIDLAAKSWVFDVIPGTDRSASQYDISPVSFSTDYQNISGYTYTENYQNYKTTGYAGGAGTDENRLITTLGGEFTGLDRWETFLDCGSAATVNDLTSTGGLKLSENAVAKTLSVDAPPKVFLFDRDYFLGDLVTVVISRLGLTLDTRVEGVSEVWERDSGYTAKVRFGGQVPNMFTILKQRGEVI